MNEATPRPENWKSPVRLWKADGNTVVALDNGEVVVGAGGTSGPENAQRIAHQHNDYVLAYADAHDRLTAMADAGKELVNQGHVLRRQWATDQDVEWLEITAQYPELQAWIDRMADALVDTEEAITAYEDARDTHPQQDAR